MWSTFVYLQNVVFPVKTGGGPQYTKKLKILAFAARALDLK